MNAIYIITLAALPLISFLLLGLAGKRWGHAAGWVGTILMLLSFLLSCKAASDYFFGYGMAGDIYQMLKPISYTWLAFSNGLQIDMGAIQDPVSMMMIFVVTFISLMVHIFSLSYMKGEDRFPMYYAFLGLFTFSMLGLVLSSNLFQIYIFWELVGVSSFLLIGFYYQKETALAAAKKAFIVTRFADLGFLIGILVLSAQSGTLDFAALITRLSQPGETLTAATTATFLGCSALSWGLALVFMGAAGKSAMFPLHIWLPDAMEGPTPVSALIHAATMVVAGVFLVARLFPVYAYSGSPVLHYIGYIGVFTAMFAALIACTQTDIKRVLAYSTISQIGFMMFALAMITPGASASGPQEGFTASMFHLFTHAIFKALLFLGAGAVIHHVHSNEMKDMGGLRKTMPVTHVVFLLACLAIAGIPPFAGFFSKEQILLAAWENQRPVYWMALATSGLTAFYMFRLYFSIFWNKESKGTHHHHGEGDAFLLGPLVLLGVGTVVAGLIPFGRFLSSNGAPLHAELHVGFSVAPVLIGLTGILLGAIMYKSPSSLPDRIITWWGWLYRSAYRKFYIDEIWIGFTKGVLFNLVARPAAWIDRQVIDGLVAATGNSMEWMAARAKGLQSGKVQQYGMYFLFGIIIIVSIYLFINLPLR